MQVAPYENTGDSYGVRAILRGGDELLWHGRMRVWRLIRREFAIGLAVLLIAFKVAATLAAFMPAWVAFAACFAIAFVVWFVAPFIIGEKRARDRVLAITNRRVLEADVTSHTVARETELTAIALVAKWRRRDGGGDVMLGGEEVEMPGVSDVDAAESVLLSQLTNGALGSAQNNALINGRQHYYADSAASRSIDTVLLESLGPGESVLWRGRPGAGRVAAGGCIYAFLGPPFLLCAFLVYACCVMDKSFMHGALSGVFEIVAVAFAVIGVGFMLVPWHLARQAQRTRYAVTDKRIVIISADGSYSASLGPLAVAHSRVSSDSSKKVGTVRFSGAAASTFDRVRKELLLIDEPYRVQGIIQSACASWPWIRPIEGSAGDEVSEA